jgi:3-isopropylmalate/(R)-2-methylmalate dehydratase small subunit
MSTKFKGNVILIQGEHVNVDTAMGWYLGMDALPPAEIATKFMAGNNPDIPKIVKQGDILVCGKDFGYGKVHGALFSAMKVLGITCIVAESFATQLIQTALMFGSYLVEAPGILQNVGMGDEIEVDVESAEVINITKNKTIEGKKFPPFLIEVMNSGGQMGYLARKIRARA